MQSFNNFLLKHFFFQGGSDTRRTIGIDLLASIRANASLQIMEYNGDDLVNEQK